MTRSRLAALLASGLLVLTVAAVPTPTSASEHAGKAPWSCKLGGTGMSDNYWVGEGGEWSNPDNWSAGAPPLAGPNPDTYVCIKQGITVSIGPEVGRVDLAALELGNSAQLYVAPGTELYLWGDQDDRYSLVRSGAAIDAGGATIGGPGRLVLRGVLLLSPEEGHTARLSSGGVATRADASGQLVVDDQGSLELTGDAPTSLSEGYSVRVHGHVNFIGQAGGLTADHGTSFALLPQLRRGGTGTLVIENDRGYAEGAVDDGEMMSTFINHGLIKKIATQGVSRIAADYSASGGRRIEVEEGSLVLPDGTYTRAYVAPGATYGSGVCDEASTDCGVGTSEDRPQLAWLSVPANEEGGARVVVTQVDDPEAEGLGSAIKAHAQKLTVTRRSPAELALRYDSSLLGGRSWQDLRVKHTDEPGNYQVLGPCTEAGDVPPDEVACLDRTETQTRTEDLEDGGVIMVVRTIETSRWIVD